MDEDRIWPQGLNDEVWETQGCCIPPKTPASLASPTVPPALQALLPAELQNSHNPLMPLQHTDTTYNPSPYFAVHHQETTQCFNTEDASLQYPYHQGLTHPPSRQYHHSYDDSAYFRPNPTTLECYRNYYDYGHLNVVQCLQQNQQFQQQQNYYENIRDNWRGTSNVAGCSWLEFSMAMHNLHQPANLSPRIQQMAATFEQRQGNNYEEPSPEAEVSSASPGPEVQHSSCNPPPAVKPNLYSALLAITQGVPNMWHTHFSSTREKFSSICVAGADFDFLNLMGRPTITLRLRDKAAWRAIWPHQMEMITSKNGSLPRIVMPANVHHLSRMNGVIDHLSRRRIFPALTVSVEGLNADERPCGVWDGWRDRRSTRSPALSMDPGELSWLQCSVRAYCVAVNGPESGGGLLRVEERSTTVIAGRCFSFTKPPSILSACLSIYPPVCPPISPLTVVRQVSFTLLMGTMRVMSEVQADRCYGNPVQYERSRRFRHLVHVPGRSANGARLPSEGLRLNASKSEIHPEVQRYTAPFHMCAAGSADGLAGSARPERGPQPRVSDGHGAA
ncbi:hypothetical protein EmuJ_000053100 [Echinococcus multilocularis]|uniref:Uncharacterized protein n=1 Tax=Echinococcus multilocularis TaxID=6211 RepID=A0A087VWW1_ECHMU|nr:hypothetical protein EmuJ_000053100 [Echinococcus multilocularis]